jgi:hypothetical protein
MADEETQTGAQSGTGTDDVQSDVETGANGSNSNSGNGSGETGQSAQDSTVPQSEFDAVKSRMQAADQRASRLEQELRQLRDKDLPEAEKLQRDFKELQDSNAKLTEVNRQLALDNAFLKANAFKWKDPEAAMKLADLSEVEIGADGKVTGLEQALKKLAESKKYLLEDEAAEDGPGKGVSAPAMGGRGTQKDDKRSSRAELAKRFPALRSRG